MPTGYTAEILDGKVTTFPQFAKKCVRAFGATIHMRDESMDAEYEKRTPSTYRTESLEKAKKSLQDAKTLSDKEIIQSRKLELQKSRKYHIDSVAKAKANAKLLNKILKDAQKWQPPTSEHTGIKDFMVDQIVQTINGDCKTDYHEKGLKEIDLELKSLSAKKIRKEMIASAKKEIAYYQKELDADIIRCEESNKWVEVFMESIK